MKLSSKMNLATGVIEIKKLKILAQIARAKKKNLMLLNYDEGPASTMSNTITRQEAEELHKALMGF